MQEEAATAAEEGGSGGGAGGDGPDALPRLAGRVDAAIVALGGSSSSAAPAGTRADSKAGAGGGGNASGAPGKSQAQAVAGADGGKAARAPPPQPPPASNAKQVCVVLFNDSLGLACCLEHCRALNAQHISTNKRDQLLVCASGWLASVATTRLAARVMPSLLVSLLHVRASCHSVSVRCVVSCRFRSPWGAKATETTWRWMVGETSVARPKGLQLRERRAERSVAEMVPAALPVMAAAEAVGESGRRRRSGASVGIARKTRKRSVIVIGGTEIGSGIGIAVAEIGQGLDHAEPPGSSVVVLWLILLLLHPFSL